MCCNKILCVCLMVTLACVFGCSKQEKTSAMKKSAEIPDISKSAPKNSDTADIFKEFYSDDTAQKNPGKKQSNKFAKAEPKNHTFSPASAGASAGEFSENGRYVLQVSCVKSRAYAKKMAEGLKEKGYPAYVAEVGNPTPALSGDYYRVRIGGFSAYSSAKAFGENTLSPSGLQYWVDKKANDKVGIEGSGLAANPPTHPPQVPTRARRRRRPHLHGRRRTRRRLHQHPPRRLQLRPRSRKPRQARKAWNPPPPQAPLRPRNRR